MVTTALAVLGIVAALLSPVLVLVGLRMRLRRAELVELSDRVEQRDATIATLWDYVLELRYWIVKGQEGAPPTMPDTLTVAAVRARISA